MKVLVADKFEAIGIDGMKALGVEVLFEPELKDDSLRDRLAESKAEILVVRSTKVTAPMIESSSLGLIIRAGAGVNTIDVQAASDRGVYVANCPGKNSQAVAELALGLMLAADRRIPDNVTDARAGKWNKKKYSMTKGLYGRTLGIVGMGKIGQEVAVRAKAFGMNVVTYSRWMTAEIAATLGVGRAGSVEELAAQADIISVHVSLTSDTRGSIGPAFFKAMKPGAIFVNTSRAEVVDQAAMEASCRSGSIFVATDVFNEEPSGGEGEFSSSLCDCPNMYITHHIGASTEQAQNAVAEETVRIVREYVMTGSAPNVVNVMTSGSPATHVLVVRHQDKVGVLAHVLDVLKSENASVQEMENIVLGGAHAAIAQIAIDKELSSSALTTIRAQGSIFDASLIPVSGSKN